jgi:hypothetical protein
MKKLSLLFLSIAVALTAAAGVVSKGNAYRPTGKASHATSFKAPEGVDIITEQPEGTVVNYSRSGEFILSSFYGYEPALQTGRVKLVYAPDGKTVYIEDPLCYAEGTGVWVYGMLTEDGTSISVPLGQYVSYNEEYDSGLILAWGSTDVIDLGDDLYWLDFIIDDRATEVTYEIDPENGTITMVGGEGDVTNPYPYDCVATGLAGIWSDDSSVATIEWKTTWAPLGEDAPAVPANPDVLEFFDSGNEEGYTRFDFNINLTDVDGNPLNSDNLTYSIFTDDDQLFTFDYDTYGANNNFDTDMTEIPYGYSGYDFYLRRVYFYRTNEGDNPMFNWRIGIQVYYTVDGVRNASDIVYLEVYPQPEPPTPEGAVLVLVDQDGVEHMFELQLGDDGDYYTYVTLDNSPWGQFEWDENLSDWENEANRPNIPFYFLIDGKRFGPEEGNVETVLGYAPMNPLTDSGMGYYTVPFGFHYVIGFTQRDSIYYVYAALTDDNISVNEIDTNKTVAGVRYFNVMGQEMQEANGMTIVVTTYTDGPTSAVKVMK